MKETGVNLVDKILFQAIFLFDWEALFKIDELNAYNSTKMYLDLRLIMLLDRYEPLRRFNKYKLKFKSKPSWITLGVQKSISVKHKLLIQLQI